MNTPVPHMPQPGLRNGRSVMTDERRAAVLFKFASASDTEGNANPDAMNSKITPLSRPRLRPRNGGFTLMEVLVAILVLSIGVLGMVGLQAASLQANRDARHQSSAVRLATELGEMMRGNKDVAIATSAATNRYLLANFPTTSPSYTDCHASFCSTVDAVAQSDVRNWLTRVSAELPSPRVVVCFDATPYDAAGRPQWNCTDNGGTAVVKIGWTRLGTDRGTDAAATAPGFDLAIRPSVVMPLIAGSSS